MKTEVITQRILTADEGMYLTDGEIYGKTVVLPMSADSAVWREVAQWQLPEKEEENGI